MHILGHADAGRDALIRAALAPPAEARTAWDAWTRSGADPHRDPVAERWMPLIGWNLRHTEVDEATRTRWREARQGVWVWNVRAIEAARLALAALVADGIPIILLKGAALATTVYPETGLRLVGDVDVLVPAADRTRACALLARDGWTPMRPIGEHLLAARHALDLRKPPHGLLDLHWHLLHETCWAGADEGLWRRCRPACIAGVTAAVLDPADQLMHACVHGLRWTPVHAAHWIGDAAWILRAHPDLDWSILLDEARRRRLGRQVWAALTCVRSMAAAPVPDDVLEALRGQPASTRDRLECRLKSRAVVTAGGLFVIWCGWRRAVELGGQRVGWLDFLSAAAGLSSTRQLPSWFTRHAIRRLTSRPA